MILSQTEDGNEETGGYRNIMENLHILLSGLGDDASGASDARS